MTNTAPVNMEKKIQALLTLLDLPDTAALQTAVERHASRGGQRPNTIVMPGAVLLGMEIVVDNDAIWPRLEMRTATDKADRCTCLGCLRIREERKASRAFMISEEKKSTDAMIASAGREF